MQQTGFGIWKHLGVLPSRKSWYLVLTLHVPSPGTITTIKYSCQVQMLPEPSKMTPNMFILNDSFTKSSLLQLFACPGKVSCEGGCTGLQAQENTMHAMSHIERLWNNWTSFMTFKNSFYSSYHLSPRLIMSEFLSAKSSSFNQAQ